MVSHSLQESLVGEEPPHWMRFGIGLIAIISMATLIHYFLILVEYPVPRLIGGGAVILTVMLAAGVVLSGGGYVHSILLGMIPGAILGIWEVFVSVEPLLLLPIFSLIAGFSFGTIGYLLGEAVTHRRVTRVTVLPLLIGALATVVTVKLCFAIGMCGGPGEAV